MALNLLNKRFIFGCTWKESMTWDTRRMLLATAQPESRAPGHSLPMITSGNKKWQWKLQARNAEKAHGKFGYICLLKLYFKHAISKIWTLHDFMTLVPRKNQKSPWNQWGRTSAKDSHLTCPSQKLSKTNQKKNFAFKPAWNIKWPKEDLQHKIVKVTNRHDPVIGKLSISPNGHHPNIWQICLCLGKRRR